METLSTYNRPEEAHQVRMRLASVGLESFVADECFIQWDPLMSNALGGVRLRIAPEQLEEARAFLREDAGLPPDEETVLCPRCGWRGAEREGIPRWFILGLDIPLVWFALPFFLSGHRWRCNRCLCAWDETKSKY